MLWSGICYSDDTCELLVNYEENEDKSGVVQSDFEEDSDDVMKEMKTYYVFKSSLVDTL